VRGKIQEIIEVNTKEKMTGADHRMIAIVLHLSTAQASVDPAILLLVDTVVGICEFLYLPQEKWAPHHFLQMYK